MSQAQTNIGPVKASYKTAPQSAQGRTAQSPERRGRPRTSADQRVKLSVAQLAYIANDPRWIEHRRKLAAVQEARRMTLFENEITAIVVMRKEGQSFKYISNKIGVCREVITRELAALGITAEIIKLERQAHQTEVVGNNVPAILQMRKKGRTFDYIAAELGISYKMMMRELTALGHSTERVKADRRVRRSTGFWRSFDPA